MDVLWAGGPYQADLSEAVARRLALFTPLTGGTKTMDSKAQTIPKSIAVAICLSLLAVLLGFVLGGIFGAVESSIKGHLDDSGSAVLDTVYGGDVAAKDAVVRKSWAYLKRAHMHGGAIGSVAIGCILTLIVLCQQGPLVRLSALSLGSGALLYSLFWLLAGFTAPGLGSTGVAKESLSIVAVPGAALCILGLCGTIFCVAKSCFSEPTET